MAYLYIFLEAIHYTNHHQIPIRLLTLLTNCITLKIEVRRYKKNFTEFENFPDVGHQSTFA